MTTREAFEAFISAPPFEMPIERFDDRSAWPGSYTELEVDLAWQAWQAATDAALERVEKACEEEAADIRSEGKGCHTGQYDHMADGAGRCAQAIRALKEKP